MKPAGVLNLASLTACNFIQWNRLHCTNWYQPPECIDILKIDDGLCLLCPGLQQGLMLRPITIETVTQLPLFPPLHLINFKWAHLLCIIFFSGTYTEHESSGVWACKLIKSLSSTATKQATSQASLLLCGNNALLGGQAVAAGERTTVSLSCATWLESEYGPWGAC